MTLKFLGEHTMRFMAFNTDGYEEALEHLTCSLRLVFDSLALLGDSKESRIRFPAIHGVLRGTRHCFSPRALGRDLHVPLGVGHLDTCAGRHREAIATILTRLDTGADKCAWGGAEESRAM
jgi:hypothetical protein